MTRIREEEVGYAALRSRRTGRALQTMMVYPLTGSAACVRVLSSPSEYDHSLSPLLYVLYPHLVGLYITLVIYRPTRLTAENVVEHLSLLLLVCVSFTIIGQP